MYQYAPEHQYNFKVKVNYQNGAITIHGPGPTPSLPNSVPLSPIFVQTGHATPTPLNYPTIPFVPSGGPFNPVIANPQPFLAHSSSQSQPFDLQTANFNKIKQQNINNINVHSQIDLQNGGHQVKNISFPLSNQLQRGKVLNCQIDNQPEINCVICQKKFKSHDFQYHIDLHRNSNKKKINNAQGTQIIPLQLLQEIEHENQNNILKKTENSFQNEVKPQLLYSFENKNNIDGQIHSRNNSQFSSPDKIIIKNGKISSRRSSVKSNCQGKPDLVIQPPTTQIQQISTGVIIAPQFTSNLSKNIDIGTQQFNTNNTIQHIKSERSSQNHHIIHSARSSTHKPIQNQSDPFQIIPSHHQFDYIEHEQSKIYQYFPEPGHYSISQHRVDPVLTASNKKGSLRNKMPGGAKTITYNYIPIAQRPLEQRTHNHHEVRSQCSQTSSINDIQSMRQPLESMSKQQLVKAYHSKRNQIDFSKIVGMSEGLARQRMTNNSGVINWNDEASKKVRSQTVCKKDRKVSSNHVMLKQNLMFDKQDHDIKNPILTGFQNRQIYRGTQVNQNDLREYDSILNGSKNSKSSSAKTKLPLNYLAVNDFISGSSSQYI